MNEGRATCVIVLVVLVAVYHVHQWAIGDSIVECPDELWRDVCAEPAALSGSLPPPPPPPPAAPPRVPLPARTDVCPAEDVLTLLERPPRRCRLSELRARRAAHAGDNPDASTYTIVVLLLISTLKSMLDVLRDRREKLRREAEPEEARRRSLAEFAERNARRDSERKSLLELTEPFMASRRRARPYDRADSTNSYLAERAPAAAAPDPPRVSGADSPVAAALALDDRDLRLKKVAALRLFGARPAPLVRRSSVPAMPHHPHPYHHAHAHTLAHPALDQLLQRPRRLSTCDSDDEADPARARRVRLIRRH